MINKLEHLTGQAAADILGVHPETLRRWEDKGELGFDVLFTSGGHRRYAKADILRLKQQISGQDKNIAVQVIEKEVAKPRESEDLGNGMTRHYFNDGTGESVVEGGGLWPSEDEDEPWPKEYDDAMFDDNEVVKYMKSLKGSENYSLISVAGRGEETLRSVISRNVGQGYTFDVNMLSGKYAGCQAAGSVWPEHKGSSEQYGISKDLRGEAFENAFLDVCSGYSFIAEISVDKNGWLQLRKIIELIPERIDIPEGYTWYRRDPNQAGSFFSEWD